MDSSEALFDALSIRWDRSLFRTAIPDGDVPRAVKRFLRSMPQFVWEAAQLEGNPYTFPEVQTLLDGVTVGGRKLSDTQQILGLRDSIRLLADEVVAGRFDTARSMACKLNGLIAREEALERGHFRGEGRELSNVGVALGATNYQPKPTVAGAGNLIAAFEAGIAALKAHAPDTLERALALKLFMSRELFFFDGSKRTARAMMNGELLRHGIDGFSIPVSKQLAYNQAMARFYPSGEATEMMQLLARAIA
jgi:Fic family protein